MKAFGTAEEQGDQGVLTDKQRRVLDLLIENKTSKEIARTLGISPYTVDQRISLARGKLGVSSRVELAARYRIMREMPGQAPSDSLADSEGEQLDAADGGGAINTAQFSGSPAPMLLRSDAPEDALTLSNAGHEDKNACPTDDPIDHRIGPKVFEGSAGALWRMGAIVATALLLVMTILGLFAIFDQLNDMLA